MFEWFKNNLYHFFLAFLAAVVYRHPSRQIYTIGVTGTNGKTTTVELLAFILEKAGKKAAVSSSLRHGAAAMTMPGRFFLQRFLRQAVKAGAEYAVIEVTSQGISQHRHRFISWGAAVFTNLSAEHIEAHGGFENYRKVKLGFIRYVAGQVGKIFINEDDRNVRYVSDAASGGQIVLYGKSELPSQLVGEFNKYNIGAAAAVARALGISEEIIKKAVAEFSGVPGRMEFIQKKPFTVVVDYAVTPDALRQTYQTLRAMSHPELPTKLICVFGACGGGRDRWKRPEIGKIASEMCDQIILTNEDPYDENPLEIIEQIASGFSQIPNPKSQIPNCYKILDRKEAIKKAISLAQPRDTVVITGKGSERFIHLADNEKIPWSDKEAVLDIIKR